MGYHFPRNAILFLIVRICFECNGIKKDQVEMLGDLGESCCFAA
jgi:hypothetical protein